MYYITGKNKDIINKSVCKINNTIIVVIQNMFFFTYH